MGLIFGDGCVNMLLCETVDSLNGNAVIKGEVLVGNTRLIARLAHSLCAPLFSAKS